MADMLGDAGSLQGSRVKPGLDPCTLPTLGPSKFEVGLAYLGVRCIRSKAAFSFSTSMRSPNKAAYCHSTLGSCTVRPGNAEYWTPGPAAFVGKFKWGMEHERNKYLLEIPPSSRRPVALRKASRFS
ncbi:hypothetical protein TWF481_010717 [Arthrobotrys musiformis]|uniref:Uncharacterized protein n=1 Tax=Arthrobotrys musiformis TaxID=47236 RepID=A0AAV9W2W9_9PEZI